MEPSSSPMGKINGTDIFKSIRGGAIVLLGYIALAVLNTVSADLTSGAIDLSAILPTMPGLDLQSIVSGLLLSAASTLAELVRRSVTDYTK